MKQLLPAIAFLSALLLVRPASAVAPVVPIVGGDSGGADLTVVDGAILSGVFTNVGTFTIPAGATVTLAGGVAFEMHAKTIVIGGTLNGNGAGSAGGAGGSHNDGTSTHRGGTGLGSGGGGGGEFSRSCCVHASGGGGAAYGGAGGAGGGSLDSTPGAAGVPYGAAAWTDRRLGSGGGGGGGVDAGYLADGGAGGAGGGSILLDATTLTIAGSVTANGANGANGGASTYGAAGGGGGSGGAIVLVATTLTLPGMLGAKGGNGGAPNGGDASLQVYSGGGGGGGGGWVKAFVGSTTNALVADVSGGAGSVNGGSSGEAPPPLAGASGVMQTTWSALSLQSSAPSVQKGTEVTFTATVTGSGSAPSGDVTFLDGTSTLGTGTLANGVATFSTSALAAGAHTIVAQFGGTAAYPALSTATVTENVSTTTTTTLVASKNPAALGESISFTATVTDGASGSVDFLDGSSSLGTAQLDGTHATLSTSSLTVGSHAITAVYSGDASHTSSTSAVLTEVIDGVDAGSISVDAGAVVSTEMTSGNDDSGCSFVAAPASTCGPFAAVSLLALGLVLRRRRRT